jgi:uncharacterized protein involved in response to NO
MSSTASVVTKLSAVDPEIRRAFERARERETRSSHLLLAFISTGLLYMLLPGTFLGVWNLLHISSHHTVQAVSDAWIQAHGYAQVFGWVGSFILGIGFYSIPKPREKSSFAFEAGWLTWVVWTVAVGMRWWANVYLTDWQILLPVSAALQLAAFLTFLWIVSGHRMTEGAHQRSETWVWMVIAGCLGFLATLLVNLGATLVISFRSSSPAFPHIFDQRYLVLLTWGTLAPIVWGFSAKWMPIFLGLKPPRWRILFAATLVNAGGVALALAGMTGSSAATLLAGAVLAVTGLRMLDSPAHEPKTKGVHASFPFFVRIAYVWLMAAAILGVYASILDYSGGIWGASRHALTVGFIAMMVFSVGQRVLPGFAGMTLLFSARLMFASLALLNLGCLLRVSSEFLAYQGYAPWAWTVLPVSAVIELAAVTAFAVNMGCTFIFRRQFQNPQSALEVTRLDLGKA